MQALGERDQANSNYSTALTIWDQLPDGWLSWGSHCDEMYESSGNHAWLEYAVSCYLQAVKHGSCAGRTMLPRVLHLLSFENDTGAVGRALDRKLNEVWVRIRVEPCSMVERCAAVAAVSCAAVLCCLTLECCLID